MSSVDMRVASGFQRWLGSEMFSEKYAPRYVAAYRKFFDLFDGESEPDRPLDWDTFVASLDGWAAGRISALLPRRPAVTTALLPLAEARDPFTGLRRSRRTPLL